LANFAPIFNLTFWFQNGAIYQNNAQMIGLNSGQDIGPIPLLSLPDFSVLGDLVSKHSNRQKAKIFLDN